MKKIAILYLSYDGLLEPLGQSQILSYLMILSNYFKIYIISFEKSDDRANISYWNFVNEKINSSGINWFPLTYHKRPKLFVKFFDIFLGTLLGLWISYFYKIKIVHARSYIPSLMAIIIKFFLNIKFIFDMRGFWVDERVDGAIWRRNNYLYKFAKYLEKQLLLKSDHIISLTNAAVIEINKFPYLQGKILNISVITTCVDINMFAPIERRLDKKKIDLVLGYVGSVGTWYLFDEVLNCFNILLVNRPNSRLIILNKNEHEEIKKLLMKKNIPTNRVEILSVPHNEVPKQLLRMDAGIFFIKPLYSKLASAPTKLAEFLSCGLPCISNIGIGDTESILKDNAVGVTINNFSSEEFENNLDKLIDLINDSEIKKRCRNTAESLFNLNFGAKKYGEIYNSLI